MCVCVCVCVCERNQTHGLLVTFAAFTSDKSCQKLALRVHIVAIFATKSAIHEFYISYDVQAVAVQGAHKGYQLQAADLTCSALSELSVYNVRRLFANRGYEAMDLRHQFVGKKPTEGRWPKIANAVIDP